MTEIIGVGGLGGSGTRVLAEILETSGLYIGDLQNSAKDNLVFTTLFKNPDRRDHLDSFSSRLQLFTRYMQGGRLSLIDTVRLISFRNENKRIVSNRIGIDTIIRKGLTKEDRREKWGWKEPNTHIYLESLISELPNFKYIHLVRNGLDMAFSSNKNQLYNWGRLFGITISRNDPEEVKAKAQLEYWIKSTKRVIQIGDASRNVLIVNHADLCLDPVREIDNILQFSDLKPPKKLLEELYSIPSRSKAASRFKESDLKIFEEQQLQNLVELGFEIN